jgi:hypothetical protein
VIGVGIGGSFDHCAKLAKHATLRPFGQKNPEPTLAAMEERLLKAVNKTGFGPMGTGGDTTALAVHIEYGSGMASRRSRSASTAGSTGAPARASTTTVTSSTSSRGAIPWATSSSSICR